MASYRECEHVYSGRPNSDFYISSVQQHLFNREAFMPDFKAQMWPSGPCTPSHPEPNGPGCPPQFFCTNSVCPPDSVHSGHGKCENIWHPKHQTDAAVLPEKSGLLKNMRSKLVY